VFTADIRKQLFTFILLDVLGSRGCGGRCVHITAGKLILLYTFPSLLGMFRVKYPGIPTVPREGPTKETFTEPRSTANILIPEVNRIRHGYVLTILFETAVISLILILIKWIDTITLI